jgi:hypothetical protein
VLLNDLWELNTARLHDGVDALAVWLSTAAHLTQEREESAVFIAELAIRTSTQRKLEQVRILRIHGAAISGGIASQREVLLAGLPKQFSLSLGQRGGAGSRSLGAQLLIDLEELNVAALLDGIDPLVVWLKNAAHLTRSSSKNHVFVKALEDRLESSSTGARLAKGKGWDSRGISIVVVTCAITSLIAIYAYARANAARVPEWGPDVARNTIRHHLFAIGAVVVVILLNTKARHRTVMICFGCAALFVGAVAPWLSQMVSSREESFVYDVLVVFRDTVGPILFSLGANSIARLARSGERPTG